MLYVAVTRPFFVVLASAVLFSWRTAGGTAEAPSHRLGILGVGFNAEVSLARGTPRREALGKALGALGLHEGKNFSFVERIDDGSRPDELMDALTKGARELVAAGVELIVAGGSTEALAAERTTSTIPIVFWSGEPIAEGLVTNLDHPGGNATGIVPAADVHARKLELLDQLVPGSAPVGYLFNASYLPGVGVLQATQQAAASLGMRLEVFEASDSAALDVAFARFAAKRVRAVVVGNHGLFRRESRRLVRLSTQHRIPLISPYPEARDAGALLSYVPDFRFWSRRAAEYIARILAGAKAGDLPVEQSVPSVFTVNLTNAAALGIQVPEPTIRLLDRVIR
jgi:putative ABC transport system substrate-binding protein